MTGNASVHDEARWSRQRRARAEDEAEEAANQRKNAGNDICSLYSWLILRFPFAYSTQDAQSSANRGEHGVLILCDSLLEWRRPGHAQKTSCLS